MKNLSISHKWEKNYTKKSLHELGVIVKLKGIKDKVKETDIKRKRINICIALDVSSSMHGAVSNKPQTNYKKNYINSNSINDLIKNMNNRNNNEFPPLEYKTKLDLAKSAAMDAISQMNDDDIISIVTFSDSVKVVAKGIQAKNKTELFQIISGLSANGCTDLFEGWRQSALCVADNLNNDGINRVLLITDGETNFGITKPEEIVSNIKVLAEKGISTSTFGVGNQYNENLLQDISDVGDGNFYYIKDEENFSQMFSDEFNSIFNISGKKVSLSYIATGFGESLTLLNDFKEENGIYKLPNLSNNNDILIGFKGIPSSEESRITLKIEYETLKGEKVEKSYSFKVICNGEEFSNQEVIDKINELKVSLIRKEAILELDKGNRDVALRKLNLVGETLSTSSLNSRGVLEGSIQSLSASLKSGDDNNFRKQAFYDNYNTRVSKSR